MTLDASSSVLGQAEALVTALSAEGVGTLGWPDDVLGTLERLEWHRLGGVLTREKTPSTALPGDLFAGLLGIPTSFGYTLRSDGVGVTLAVGAPAPHAQTTASLVQLALGGHPTSSLAPTTVIQEAASYSTHCGALSVGLAGDTEPCVESLTSVADVLLDATHGSPFGYHVLATPVPRKQIKTALCEAEAAAEAVDRNHLQVGTQPNLHRRAARVRDALDLAARRFRALLAQGAWRTSIVVRADDETLVRRILALVLARLQMDTRRGSLTLASHVCHPDTPGGIHTRGQALRSDELARACLLPQRDRMGFSVRPLAHFSVDHTSIAEGVALGAIQDGVLDTGRFATLRTDVVCKHALVVGHTGFGKSTSVRALLGQLATQRTPFLVIEPAKGEYQALASSVENLLVLRVGAMPREGEIPFQFNPLAFPVGVALHTHVDLIKQAFVAAFGLVPPAPYLLETALHRAYEERGWNLATGEHPEPGDALSFPILSELLHHVDDVVNDAAYAGEVTANLRAALRVRLASLCHGPKGLTFDTRVSFPDHELFERPIVLELKHLGSDEEKAFAMALVLTRLYQWREIREHSHATPRLEHLLVIEEAHRLLAARAERPLEDGNGAHHAVSTFANVIAELRAYGQGILLVEQIPSKLAPEAVKQTELKIVHRLLSRDDRELVSGAMDLDAEQTRAIARLNVGEALVSSEAWHGAMRVSIRAVEPTSASLRDRATAVLDTHWERAVMRRVAAHREQRVLCRAEVVAHADGFITAVLLNSGVTQAQTAFRAAVAASSSNADSVCTLAIDDAIERRGLFYGWTERTVFEVQQAFAAGTDAGRAALRQALTRCRTIHTCGHCAANCTLAFEARKIARDERFQSSLDAIAELQTDDWGASLLNATHTAVERALGSAFHDAPRELLLCVLGTALKEAGLSSKENTALLGLVARPLQSLPDPLLLNTSHPNTQENTHV